MNLSAVGPIILFGAGVKAFAQAGFVPVVIAVVVGLVSCYVFK